MTTRPAISALMTCYNSASFVREAIDSVLAQDFPDFEFIIVDDASTDETQQIILSYRDPRIRFFQLDQNVGVGAALQFGLAKVSAPLIAKIDSDDISLPKRFRMQKQALDNDPSIALVKSLIEYFPDNEQVANSSRFTTLKKVREKQLNDVRSPDAIHAAISGWCCIAHGSIMARSDAIKKIGYSDARMEEDYQLFYNLDKAGYRMSCVQEVLILFRVRDGSITSSQQHQDSYASLLIELKHDAIEAFFDKKSCVFIWGTGGLGKSLYRALPSKRNLIKAFVDRHCQDGEMLFGVPILKPEDLEIKDSSTGVIVAAQPIREDAVNFLMSRGFNQPNYFVFA